MNVLEELWYGNLEPSEFDSSSARNTRSFCIRLAAMRKNSWQP